MNKLQKAFLNDDVISLVLMLREGASREVANYVAVQIIVGPLYHHYFRIMNKTQKVSPLITSRRSSLREQASSPPCSSTPTKYNTSPP